MTGRNSTIFINGLAVGLTVAALMLSAGHAAPGDAAGQDARKKGSTPIGTTTVPLPSRSLVDDPFERMQRQDGLAGGQAGQYQKCLDLILVDAGEAFEAGSVWRDQGGGAPAQHCIALALMELGHYGEGASRLEQLAGDPGAGAVAIRVQILSQAGNGWLLQDQARRAIAAFTSGINLGREDKSVDTSTLIFDRARAYALIEQWGPVYQDLTDVLAKHPRHLSALILRATAGRHLKRHHQAAQDIASAAGLSSGDPAMLIERAVQSLNNGERTAARRDLLAAAVNGEKTPMAKIAQDLLAQMDVNMDGVGVTGQAEDPIARVPIEIERRNTGPRVATGEPATEMPKLARTTSVQADEGLKIVTAEPEPEITYSDTVPRPVKRPGSGKSGSSNGKKINLRTRIKR